MLSLNQQDLSTLTPRTLCLTSSSSSRYHFKLTNNHSISKVATTKVALGETTRTCKSLLIRWTKWCIRSLKCLFSRISRLNSRLLASSHSLQTSKWISKQCRCSSLWISSKECQCLCRQAYPHLIWARHNPSKLPNQSLSRILSPTWAQSRNSIWEKTFLLSNPATSELNLNLEIHIQTIHHRPIGTIESLCRHSHREFNAWPLSAFTGMIAVSVIELNGSREESWTLPDLSRD